VDQELQRHGGGGVLPAVSATHAQRDQRMSGRPTSLLAARLVAFGFSSSANAWFVLSFTDRAA
jgi:hypothetical protein